MLKQKKNTKTKIQNKTRQTTTTKTTTITKTKHSQLLIKINIQKCYILTQKNWSLVLDQTPVTTYTLNTPLNMINAQIVRSLETPVLCLCFVLNPRLKVATIDTVSATTWILICSSFTPTFLIQRAELVVKEIKGKNIHMCFHDQHFQLINYLTT